MRGTLLHQDVSTVDTPKMDREKSEMTKRILDLTMEIIYLLTGEKYAVVRMASIEGLLQGIYPSVLEGCSKNQSTFLEPAPHCLTLEKNNTKQILEVTQKIIELLAGEVPIRCQDVTVYFSTEEWEYLEGNKDLYKDVMMEDQPPLTSPDGSRKRSPPESCPRPLYSPKSSHDEHTIPPPDQGDVLNHGSLLCVEEEVFLVADDQCLQEAIPSELDRDGHHTSRSSKKLAALNDVFVVPDSQEGNPFTPSHGPHLSKQACAIPNIHSELQSSSGPSNNEESSFMNITRPDSLLELSRSPHPSVPVKPPDKLHTAPNIIPELDSSERLPHAILPQKSSLDVSQILKPDIHLKLQNEDRLMDIACPVKSTQGKTHTSIPDIGPVLHSSEKSPHATAPQESSHSVSQTLILDIHLNKQIENRLLDIANPEERAHDQTDATIPNMNSGLQNMNRSPDSKENSFLKLLTFRSALNRLPHSDPSIYSGLHSLDKSVDPSNVRSSPTKAHMLAPNIISSSPDTSQAFTLNIHPGFHSVDESADPSNPKESTLNNSDKATIHVDPESPTPDRLPVTLNPEVCHPMDSQTVTPNSHLEFQQSLDEPSNSSHATPNVNSDLCSENRPADSCNPDEHSAVSDTIQHIISTPCSVDRPPDDCNPDELSAISNMNSEFHNADKKQDPASLGTSSLVTLHTVRPNMHLSLNRSPDPSDLCESCEKVMPATNLDLEFASSSQSPQLTNAEGSLPDNFHFVTPNSHSDHQSTNRLPDLMYPKRLHTATQDFHRELPSVGTQNSPESAPMNTNIISSELNRCLDSAYSEESSASHAAPNVHSGIDKTSRSLQHPNLGFSLLKSDGDICNVHSLTSRLPDPSANSFEPSNSSENINLGLQTKNKSVHTTNSVESSLDVAHAVYQNTHLVDHNAVRTLEITNLNEFCSEKSQTGTPDIYSGHHSFNKTVDLEGSCPMKSVITTPNIYSELRNSSNSSFSAKFSGLNTATNIHSVEETADQSPHPHIPEHLSSSKLLVVTLNVQPDPYYPEEYSLIKSIISPNIRSIRGKSPVLDEFSDRCSTPNINLEQYSSDKSLHPSYSEEFSLDVTQAVDQSIYTGPHTVDRTLDTEVSSPIDIPLDLSYPNRSAANSYLSSTLHAEYQSENRSLYPSYPEEFSLDIYNVDRTLDTDVFSPMDRPLDLSHPSRSAAKPCSSFTINSEYYHGNRSPDSSVAVQYTSSASLGVTSNIIPELHIVNESPNLSYSKECSMELQLADQCQEPSGHQESTEAITLNIHLEPPGVHSLPCNSKECLPRSYAIFQTTYPELKSSDDRSSKSLEPKGYMHDIIPDIHLEPHKAITSTIHPELKSCMDRSPKSSEPQSHVMSNIHLEPCKAITPSFHSKKKSSMNRSSKSSELKGSSSGGLHDVISDILLEPHKAIYPEPKSSLMRTSNSSEPQEPSLEKSHVVPNIHLEPCKDITAAIHPKKKYSMNRSSKSFVPKGSSSEKSYNVIADIHLETCKAITSTIHSEPKRSVDRSSKSSELQVSSLEKSHVVTPNIQLEHCKAITSTINSEEKSSVNRSSKSSELQESSVEKSRVVNPNIHLEPHKAITPTIDPEPMSSLKITSNSSKPHGSFLEKSHFIPHIHFEPYKASTPSIHPEKNSMNRSSKSSEPKGSSSEMLHDVASNIHLEPCKAITQVTHPEKKSSMNKPSKSSDLQGSSLEKLHDVLPNIHLEPCKAITPTIHSEPKRTVDRLSKSSEPQGSPVERSHVINPYIHLEPYKTITPTIQPELKSSLKRRSNSSEPQGSLLEKSHVVIPDIHLAPCMAITSTIHGEQKSGVKRSSKSSKPEGSSLKKSCVIPNIDLEPHKAYTSTIHAELKSSENISSDSPGSLEKSHDVIPKIHLETCKAITPTILPEHKSSVDKSSKSSEHQGSSWEMSDSVIPKIHSETCKAITPTIHPKNKNDVDKSSMSFESQESSLDKSHVVITNTNLEPNKTITPTIHAEEKGSVKRSLKSSEPKRSLEKSHDVIPNIHLEPCKAITPSIHPEQERSMKRSSSSEKSHAITPTILSEPKSSVNRSSKSSEPETSSEKSHDVSLKIHLEPCKAITPSINPQQKSSVKRSSKSYEPKGSSLEKSHAITPTILAEPKRSVNRSSKSSEPKTLSLKKLQDVTPKIELDSHKADKSPDTSNTHKTSSVKPCSNTLYSNVGLRKLDVSRSEKHSQNTSHALTTNISSKFNDADRLPDPPNPKRSSPVNSVNMSKKKEQNGSTKFSCSVCYRSFRSHSIFLKHWEIYCGKLLRKKSLRNHSSKIQSVKILVPPVKLRKLIKKKGVVLKEPNTQTPKTKCKCPECGKLFSQKCNLLQHRRIHTGVKPFTCLHCGKRFTKKISLVTHIRIHSGERPFSCPQCNKCYGQRGHLDRHMRTHTGEKPYSCPECGKSFLQNCDLVKHRRIHTGVRPYQCSECEKTFTESSGLRKHRRKMHQ